jgi:hypothetical protein
VGKSTTDDAISRTPQDPGMFFVALRERLRSVARDTENCAEILDVNQTQPGFFQSGYGTI